MDFLQTGRLVLIAIIGMATIIIGSLALIVTIPPLLIGRRTRLPLPGYGPRSKEHIPSVLRILLFGCSLIAAALVLTGVAVLASGGTIAQRSLVNGAIAFGWAGLILVVIVLAWLCRASRKALP